MDTLHRCFVMVGGAETVSDEYVVDLPFGCEDFTGQIVGSVEASNVGP